mgnify:CR=1 FL=1
MKAKITFLIFSLFFFSINFPKDHTSANSKQYGIEESKFQLHCPDPPAFVQTVNDKTVMKDDKENFDQGWYQQAIEKIRQDEYNITYSDELGAYQSPNRANNIRFIYHKDGFTAKTRSNKVPLFDVKDKTIEEKDKKYEKIEEWDIQLRVTNYELRNNVQCSMSNVQFNDFSGCDIKVDKNKAFIENENLRIEYLNDENGMRQDFIIKNKPAGEEKLRLNLSADTKLKMIVGADALMFKDHNGEEKMKYTSLKCWDANHKELRAYFERSDKLQIANCKLQKEKSSDKNICNLKSDICNCFSIVVNDEDAVYPVTIDPLSSSPNWTAESDQASAQFGFSVSTAGDVNGDGYSDVIIGAKSYDNGQTDEGRAYVYHGSASGLSALANWTAEGNQASANFGWSVSTAGDVNDDGYSDVIIGAPLFDNGQTNEGRAYVYYGSATGLSATVSWNAESNQAESQFGFSVSTAGDVNGDGFSDVIVGARFFVNGQVKEGRVFVYHGSASGLSASANWTAESDQANAWFGYSVCTAGDVNGDGCSDVIVGAYLFDNVETDEGRAFVYHGSATGLSASANWTAESNQTTAWFGYSVSTAGDVNGDGYSDVIVGAILFDNGETDEGGTFVYHGSASGLSASANWTAECNQAVASFGFSVSTAGDVNGDGYSDVIVGAVSYDSIEIDEGRVFVYNGSASGLSASANWTAESDQTGAQFGYSVSTAGDVNGDGFSDVITGAGLYDNGQSDEGRAFVYHGSASGPSVFANKTLERNQANASFGCSLSTAGDVNGDGYSDVIVGALFYDNGQTSEGRVFVYHGSANGLSGSPNWTAESNQAFAYFGNSVSTAGDVNGDGYSDVIIGAEAYDNGQTDEGRVYVYHGSASGLSSSPNWTEESNQGGAFFAISVSTAGDVNGDGYSDVIVGSLNFTSGFAHEGKAFVYHGSSSGLSNSANWSALGNQAQSNFGYSVSTAGDVNGDGYSDVIVGAYNYDNGQTDEGRAFVYHGSASGLSMTSNWSAEGDQTNAFYGFSVSAAGDVNGDGYSDIIVGARLFSNGQTYEGRAFAYYGSSSGLSATSNWTAESDQESAFFGWSVSTAGDVNGDGYSDVIVGAKWYSNGQTKEGRAYVYNGSPSGLSSAPVWTAESDQANAEFGTSVSTAGDVNGDGYSDVIVGAPMYNNGETDEGSTFVYYGNGLTGLRSTVQQYKPGTSFVVSSGGLTGTDGQVRLNVFGRSPFGRADGMIVFEYKRNGNPFSGTVITNSTSSSGSGTFVDLGPSGSQLNKDITGFATNRVYKWRARVKYSLVNNPYQKFGPWKYYNNYTPNPLGNFRAKAAPPVSAQLNLTILIQGFYDAGANSMTGDTVRVYLRNSNSPYAIEDSAKAFVNSSGQGTFIFSNASNGTPYYIQIVHRNSIETWSKNPQQFTASALTYNFTTANTKAYGDNMVNIDASPVRYGIYSGDEDQNGIVDLSDVVNVSNAGSAFTTGYVSSDMNGDNIVDLSDLVITSNNAGAFVAAIVP